MTDQEIYYCSKEEFIKNAKLPVRVMDTGDDMYREIARIMADTIKNNGDNQTVIICPVGPIAQYPYFVEIVNTENISLKNCIFINMDEYLVEGDKLIPYENMLSFKQIWIICCIPILSLSFLCLRKTVFSLNRARKKSLMHLLKAWKR
ncbi:MAG: hypothetical protein IKM06_03545 [Clostridia bacterium]|nr:hypothetical protein [Clostridia bacterium]